MKLIALILSSLFLFSWSLPANPLPAKGKAKITKNEAEHIALKRFPGARVASAKLETIKGTLVWSLQIAEGNAKPAHPIAVDAMTGRIAENQP